MKRPHILSHRTASHYAKTSDGTLSVTRRQVAEHFGKQDFHVLRNIRNVESNPEFNASNFGLVEYFDGKGEARAEYAATRDGFTPSVTHAASARKTLNRVSNFAQATLKPKVSKFTGLNSWLY